MRSIAPTTIEFKTSGAPGGGRSRGGANGRGRRRLPQTGSQGRRGRTVGIAGASARGGFVGHSLHKLGEFNVHFESKALNEDVLNA